MFPCIRAYNSHKLQPKSIECIFLGYAAKKKKLCALILPITNFTLVDMYSMSPIFHFVILLIQILSSNQSSMPNINLPPSLPLKVLPKTIPSTSACSAPSPAISIFNPSISPFSTAQVQPMLSMVAPSVASPSHANVESHLPAHVPANV